MIPRFLLCLSFAFIAAGADGDLPRRGDLGATWRHAADSIEIRAVSDNGFAARLGLKTGDRIRSINGSPAAQFLNARLVAGASLTLDVLRDGRGLTLTGALPEAVRETYPGVAVIYDGVNDSAGNRLRTIVTRPRDSAPRLTIFVAGWLSCDGIEAPEGTRDATSLVFRELA